MNTTLIITKREYNSPSIEKIVLDNEISLELQSIPPIGPDETNNHTVPEYFNNEPFRKMA